MQEKYQKHITWWLDEFSVGDQVDHYFELFPEFDSRIAKFAVGIFLWNMKGLIDINISFLRIDYYRKLFCKSVEKN